MPKLPPSAMDKLERIIEAILTSISSIELGYGEDNGLKAQKTIRDHSIFCNHHLSPPTPLLLRPILPGGGSLAAPFGRDRRVGDEKKLVFLTFSSPPHPPSFLRRVVVVERYPSWVFRGSGRKSLQKEEKVKVSKQCSPDPGFSGYNPFDSDSESDLNHKTARASSAPVISRPKKTSSKFSYNGDEGNGASSSSSYSGFSTSRIKYKNDFRDSGGFENQSVQELENHAVYKAEETTHKINGCLKIAEEMRGDASRTLISLHQQGQKITQTHLTAADIDHDLSRGEKLLGSLGGIFSKTWKPKKNREIKGPVLTRDDSFIQKGSHMEQRQKLGLSGPLCRSNPRTFPSEPTSALEKVEIEKAKQNDALSDLSDLLVELKDMAMDMGGEIERHTGALDRMQDDVDELNFRVKRANIRGRRLLGK
ncbi:SNAP25 homologous protein SNAP33 [Phoenix dactylifera]|uniref:SNAP25 homologous protein SNAP33 n=1 Tax=Phoenix dactylifera TaxID=42345 RepID=A0A8B8ZJY6_PHODC|nr:SNAP25 homologous protein SNAP33 [Phoenix dactylifera]